MVCLLNSLKVKKIAFILLASLIIIYIVFQVLYTKTISINTETAVITTAHDEYEVDGYVFRDEILIPDSSNGSVVSYSVLDGSTVARGEAIASVYSNEEDVKAQAQIKKLQSELATLEELQKGDVGQEMSLENVNSQLYDCITQGQLAKSSESYLGTDEARAKVLGLLNERHVIIGNTVDFTSKINELTLQIDQLKNTHNSNSRTIQSPESGYFISYINGYENSYDYNKIKQISPNEIQNGFTKQENKSNIIGKIDKSLVWYIVCNISVSDVTNFSVGDYVNISMPLVTNDTFNAKIEAINYDSTSSLGCAAVVFACNVMNSELTKTCHEKIVIKSRENTGIKVSKNSVHVNTLTRTIKDANGNKAQETKDVQGVYVLYGKQLVFKQIFPLCATDKYIICDQDPDLKELFTDSTVQVYDKVVTKGKNLYDGKFIR